MRDRPNRQPPSTLFTCVFNMKFCTFFLLASFVSLVAALPRYPRRLGSTSPVRAATTASEKQVVPASFVELVTIASSAFSGVLLAYGSVRSPLSALWNIIRSNTHSESHRSNVDTLSMMLLPEASHPSGHGRCAEDQFWFGPKQTCVGGTGAEDFIRPPPGYYCPVDWSFSDSLRCCMPHTPRAISKNDCRNGNGTWDLIRIVCAERGSNHMSRPSSIINQSGVGR
ncbi:unnamed protein product [Rhizoctonia solani]|uniref:Uncharacterized protein n=3 Tax=Rhizoctonia solani TaxID=456999 RepID=A0A8H2X285_9AGAM|nr:transmembrane protein, putative [Rhizoctonia solani AG-3 Rhs1AP]KEP53563.1 putative transmembrane protein [Rhizoctonia solani 123E]CAE6415101.1 unnamed protein product [Rhizoctonia solani]CAE6518492.1 unnamed protein product [Rhizoctonia solani]